MKTREQIDARDQKELSKRRKQRNQKALKYGLLLTLIALFFASVTDEISSAIGVQIQSSVVTEFFAKPVNVAGRLLLLQTIHASFTNTLI